MKQLYERKWFYWILAAIFFYATLDYKFHWTVTEPLNEWQLSSILYAMMAVIAIMCSIVFAGGDEDGDKDKN